MKQYLEVGKLVNTHGIKGEMKLQLWCDDIEYLKQFKELYLDENGEKVLTLLSARSQKNVALVKFAEITSIEDAENYKNKVLYANRDDAQIEEGVNYIEDLIDCTVVDIDTNKVYGKVCDVTNYGASDILDLVKDKKHRFVPMIDDIIKEIDVDNQTISIKYMKGLFDED